MPRALLWTAPDHPIAEMVAEELREAGYPVTTTPSGLGDGIYPVPFTELWIEDASILEDGEAKGEIEEIISGAPLRPEDEEAIVQMPFRDAPEKPEVQRRRLPLWANVVIGVLIAAAVLWVGLSIYLRKL